MTEAPNYVTKSGRSLTEGDIERISSEVATTDGDVAELQRRVRRGRPPLGSAPAKAVQIRLAPELRAAVERRAQADQTTTSEVVRAAVRHYLNLGHD